MREADLADNEADRALTLFNRATKRWLVPGYEQGNEAPIELACGARLCGAAAIVAAWSSEERERELLPNLLGYAWPLPQRRWAVGRLVEAAKDAPNGAEQLPRALELVDHRFSALSVENARIGLDQRSPSAWLICHAGAFDTEQADSPSSEQISQEGGRLRHATKLEGDELVAATRVLHHRLGMIRTIADVLGDSAHADGDQVRPSAGESIWTAAAIGAAAVLAAIAGDERFLSKLWTKTLPAEERLAILTEFLEKASDAEQEM
ncbi:MAG TPA: hypothetical protein VNW92_20035, partial [Polyangiaceae bacterium]|nr:hypothetical protein [Polyangiaceae bacterium]